MNKVIFTNRILALIIIGSSLGYCFFVYSTQLFYIDDKFFSVLGDDAMISMRYAKNWADGIGIFWNPNGSVEGYTNFLLVCVMAFIHLFNPDVSTASLYVIFFNWIMHILSVYFTYAVGLRFFKDQKSALASAFFMAFSLQFLLWGSHGFETTLLTFFSITSIYYLLKRKVIIASLIMGMGVLTRDDFTIFVFVFGSLFPFMQESDFRKKIILSLKISSIPLIFFCLHIAWRYYYYGDFLPNTYYLKATGIDYSAKLEAGVRYILGLMPLILCSLWAYYRLFRKTIIRNEKAFYITFFSGILFYSLYTISVSGDAFWGARLFAPLFPIFSIAGAFLLIKNNNTNYMIFLILVIFLLYPLNKGLLRAGFSILKQARTSHYSSQGDQAKMPANVRNVLSCKMIENHALEHNIYNPSMAVYYAGIPPYMCSDFIAIDLLGKSDAYIAHTQAHYGKVGHNKYDYDYSLGEYKPTYILSLMPSIDSLTDDNYINRPLGDFNWQFLLNSEQFIVNYSKNYLRPEVNPIFIRDPGTKKYEPK
ncbi:hypothetical protein TI05_00505 [Achromatium sp. WMS3]|nr:hypothetical protein TI05_00505 [Achromatium sp. WMS3]